MEEKEFWLKWWNEGNKQNQRECRNNNAAGSEEYQPENPIKAHIRKMRSPNERMRKSIVLDRFNPSHHNEGSERGSSARRDLDQPGFDLNDESEEGEIHFIKKKEDI